jgi:hypothetical protein
MTEMDTMNHIDNRTKREPWTALWLDGVEFPLHGPESSTDEEVKKFARSTCVAQMHEYIRTEIESMAGAAVKKLQECKFARAQALANRLVDCKRLGGAKDVGYSEEWSVSGYRDCVVAAVCICKAKHHASYKKQTDALKYATRAVGALSKIECSVDECRNLYWAKRSLADIAAHLQPYIEEMCT